MTLLKSAKSEPGDGDAPGAALKDSELVFQLVPDDRLRAYKHVDEEFVTFIFPTRHPADSVNYMVVPVEKFRDYQRQLSDSFSINSQEVDLIVIDSKLDFLNLRRQSIDDQKKKLH